MGGAFALLWSLVTVHWVSPTELQEEAQGERGTAMSAVQPLETLSSDNTASLQQQTCSVCFARKAALLPSLHTPELLGLGPVLE